MAAVVYVWVALVSLGAPAQVSCVVVYLDAVCVVAGAGVSVGRLLARPWVGMVGDDKFYHDRLHPCGFIPPQESIADEIQRLEVVHGSSATYSYLFKVTPLLWVSCSMPAWQQPHPLTALQKLSASASQGGAPILHCLDVALPPSTWCFPVWRLVRAGKNILTCLLRERCISFSLQS